MPRRRAARTAPAMPLGARILAGVRALPDHRLLDRLIRGRIWIPLLGILLAGIVTMQVEVLKLGASIGRSIQRTAVLQVRNEALQTTVASLNNDQRIESLAAQQGMVMPTPGAVGFLPASLGSDVARAISNIHAPDAATFLANATTNGAIATASSATNGATGSSSSTMATMSSASQGGSSTLPYSGLPTASTQGSGTAAGYSPGATGAGAGGAGAGGSAGGGTAAGSTGAGAAGSAGAAASGPSSTTAATSAGTAGGTSAAAAAGTGSSTSGAAVGAPSQTASSQTGSSTGGAGVPVGG